MTSVIDANHRPLDASNRIFGSLMKSLAGTAKKECSVNVSTTAPCFVHTRPSAFTISTTWFGPAATWTSGGAYRFVYGPFAPNIRPSKEVTGTAAVGHSRGAVPAVPETNPDCDLAAATGVGERRDEVAAA